MATWGLSLVLQQAVRSIFGADNRNVGTPDWMSGAYQWGGVLITTNRLTIIIFSILVLAVLMAVLRYTSLGFAHAGGDAEPADGGGDGHPHAMDRRDDVRGLARASPEWRGWR